MNILCSPHSTVSYARLQNETPSVHARLASWQTSLDDPWARALSAAVSEHSSCNDDRQPRMIRTMSDYRRLLGIATDAVRIAFGVKGFSLNT